MQRWASAYWCRSTSSEPLARATSSCSQVSGAVLGPLALVSVVIYGAVVGGVIAAVMLAKRHELRRSLTDIVTHPTNLRRGGATAPYGVAIASGVYLSMLLPGVIG